MDDSTSAQIANTLGNFDTVRHLILDTSSRRHVNLIGVDQGSLPGTPVATRQPPNALLGGHTSADQSGNNKAYFHNPLVAGQPGSSESAKQSSHHTRNLFGSSGNSSSTNNTSATNNSLTTEYNSNSNFSSAGNFRSSSGNSHQKGAPHGQHLSASNHSSSSSSAGNLNSGPGSASTQVSAAAGASNSSSHNSNNHSHNSSSNSNSAGNNATYGNSSATNSSQVRPNQSFNNNSSSAPSASNSAPSIVTDLEGFSNASSAKTATNALLTKESQDSATGADNKNSRHATSNRKPALERVSFFLSSLR